MSADRRGNLEEPVLIEGEADGGGVVEGDEGGRLEDQAGHAAGLQAAPHPSFLLHINRGQSAHTKSVLWRMRIQIWFFIQQFCGFGSVSENGSGSTQVNKKIN